MFFLISIFPNSFQWVNIAFVIRKEQECDWNLSFPIFQNHSRDSFSSSCILLLSVPEEPAAPRSLPGIGNQSSHLGRAHSFMRPLLSVWVSLLQVKESGPPRNCVNQGGSRWAVATLLQLVKTHMQDFKWPYFSVKHYFYFQKAQWKQKKKMWPRGKEN